MLVRTLPTPARAVVLALALCLSAGCSKPRPPATAEMPQVVADLTRDDAGRDVFAVVGLEPEKVRKLADDKPLPEQWRAWFTVRVAGADGPPMLGDYYVSGDNAYFRPRFPLVPGKQYRVTVGHENKPGEPDKRSRFAFDVPQIKLPPPAVVAAVFPSADRLPENLLRIYLHFTGPMRRGDVYDYIHLLGPDAKRVETPFVTLGEELWNDDGARLTLFLDPGRQKHDLLPRQQAGPVLEAGKSYTLVIAADWPDVHGRPLGKEYRKRFEVVAAETRPVQPADWTITPPPAGTREPLVVAFDRSLDHALLRRVVTVADAAGKSMEGEITPVDAETRWRFVPRKPWSTGGYVLVVEKTLEDVSGNRVGRAFEVDEDRTEPGPVEAVKRVFKVPAK
jgi:hypothetical protein